MIKYYFLKNNFKKYEGALTVVSDPVPYGIARKKKYNKKYNINT